MLNRLLQLPQVTFVTIGLAAIVMVLLSIIAVARNPDPTVVDDGQFVQTESGVRPVPTFDADRAVTGEPTPNPTPVGWSTGASDRTVHTVSSGETLGSIAAFYDVDMAAIVSANSLPNPDVLEVGQELLIPGRETTLRLSPSRKLLPDSELVYSPSAQDFDAIAFVRAQNGYLVRHTETVEGKPLSGPEIVQLVADRASVGPRLLLAALEYRSGWVTQPGGADNAYPMGLIQVGWEGLYKQLEWAANQINRGYYGRTDAAVTTFLIADGTSVTYAPDINHGTAGVQTWLGAHTGATYDNWLVETGDDGFIATYEALFGNPFRFTYEPVYPDDLVQPAMDLPWMEGDSWYFTGGPHGAWASGSAWAALDFAPMSDAVGCYETEVQLAAVADGVIARSGWGHVVLDLDGDGFAGTGWAVHYLHVNPRDRIDEGTRVQRGDPIGYPGCDGGVSRGTHLHIARSYNGHWVAADGVLPFDLDGWLSSGFGVEYDGYLTRDGEQKEACVCKEPFNTLANTP